MVGTVTETVLFSAKLTNTVSSPLKWGSAYKIDGLGLGDWDYITFTLVASSGQIFVSQGECCGSSMLIPGEYARTPVMCDACCGGHPREVILTKHNPTIYLDVSTPQTYLLAQYHGDPLGKAENALEATKAHVIATDLIGAMPLNLTASQRGCPNLTPFATFGLPCNVLGFDPNLPRDPRATVELTGCDDSIIAYIYPTPVEGATAEVLGCGDTVIGYAVNNVANTGNCGKCK